FINQFLKTLYEKNVIQLDSFGKLIWDNEAVLNLQLTNEVIDLMIMKIKDLPQKDQNALKIAACIGNRFDLKTMSIVLNKSEEDILFDLSEALDSGLIFFKQDMCYFLHDRIQEAAYSLVPEDEREDLHYMIGSYIYHNTRDEELADNIFYIVNQLDAGKSNIKSEEAQKELVRLNLIAGKKAKHSAAYQPALLYLDQGIQLLKESDWETDYDLCFDLYYQAEEAAYLNTEFEKMQGYAEKILEHTNDILDQVKAREIQIQAYMAQHELEKTVKLSLEMLSSLGIKIPAKFSRFQLTLEFLKTRKLLFNKKDEQLLKLPQMNDPYYIAATRIATTSATAFTFGGYTKEISYLVFKMVNISITKGLNAYTPYWLGCLAMILHPLNYCESAFRFADLALELQKRFPGQELRTKIIVNCYINPWRKDLKGLLNKLYNIYLQGFESGDLVYSLGTATHYSTFQFFSGTTLEELLNDLSSLSKTVEKYKMLTVLNYNQLLEHSINTLIHGFDHDIPHASESLEVYKSKHKQDRLSSFQLHLFLLMLFYLFDETERAEKEASQARTYLDAGAGGYYHYAMYHFYHALTRLSLIRANKSPHKKVLQKVEHSLDKLHTWSKYAPSNFIHKYFLVKAGLLGVKGQTLQAQECFEEAIETAHTNGYIQEEALACELASLFYNDLGLHNIAKNYMSRAMQSYYHWGASAKTEQLKQIYPGIIQETQHFAGTGNETAGQDTTITSTTSSRSQSLDFVSAVYSTQIIASEIDLNKLLDKFMQIALKNSGASRGVLLMRNEEDGNLYIETEGELDKSIDVLNSVPLEGYQNLPHSLINYVRQTNEDIIINDVQNHDFFISDPFFRENTIKSILCTPIKYKGRTAGIIYLENRLSPNVFTSERIQILKILSSQAAISIENAKLYTELNRTREITVVSLSSLAETRDTETGAHIIRTQHYIKLLAERVKNHHYYSNYLNDHIIDLIFKAAPLHDIGKVGVPDHILLKPGKLNNEEFEEIKKHTIYGKDALKMAEANLGSNSFMGFAREIAYTHHEKWDGTGYPQGLQGNDIPVSGRLMAIADVYDALISKRVYKPAFTHEKAVEIIKKDKGTHFDPALVDAFLDIQDEFLKIADKYMDFSWEENIATDNVQHAN
ncbi:MAG: HD domain-containing phosphohydrolase, partial [Thermodesulfobacteriota bacterium]